MKKKNLLLALNLQLFAEGGGDGGAASGDSGGAEAGYAASGDTSVGSDDGESNLDAEFEELIKGKYKDAYAKRQEDLVKKRFKNSKNLESQYEELQQKNSRFESIAQIMSQRYGVDATDIDALTKAIEDDDAYYEQEALEKGISVENLKEIKKMERENAELKRQMQEARQKENADRIYSQWMEEAKSIKSVYPQFDLNTEMADQQFQRLLRSGIPMKTAYEVIHKDEVINGAVQFAQKETQRQVSRNIQSKNSRPKENGLGNNSPAQVTKSASQLTRSDRDEIARRVARGERVVLSEMM